MDYTFTDGLIVGFVVFVLIYIMERLFNSFMKGWIRSKGPVTNPHPIPAPPRPTTIPPMPHGALPIEVELQQKPKEEIEMEPLSNKELQEAINAMIEVVKLLIGHEDNTAERHLSTLLDIQVIRAREIRYDFTDEEHTQLNHYY